jgi:CspA family cold shock protein
VKTPTRNTPYRFDNLVDAGRSSVFNTNRVDRRRLYWAAPGHFTAIGTMMGKYRDHRAPRKRRYDDDAGTFSEQASEPSYFRRPAAMTLAPVDAEVLWFDAGKGFGFVKLSDGTEVYLPSRVLETAGSRAISEGTPLKVVISETLRGSQVTQVLEIGGQPSTIIVAGAEIEGTVKWYNPEKGFGFIAPGNGERDVFVHASALARSGVGALTEGQKVFIECGPGKKGTEVRSIRVA